MTFADFLNIPRTRTRGDFPTNTRTREGLIKNGVHAAMGLEESSAPSFVDSKEKPLHSDAFKSGASAEEQASVEPSGARSARA